MQNTLSTLKDAEGLQKETGIPTETWRYWRKAQIGPPPSRRMGRPI